MMTLRRLTISLRERNGDPQERKHSRCYPAICDQNELSAQSIVFAKIMGHSLTYAIGRERKALVRINCIRLDSVKACKGLGEIFLRILYENGLGSHH